MKNTNWTRRQVLAAGAALVALPKIGSTRKIQPMLTGAIPASGEELPVIGLGTSRVFDVDSTSAEIAKRKDIVDMLTANGGSLIDTSPMYGRAEKIIGDIIAAGVDRSNLFLATKVWTHGKESGTAQMQQSADLMRTDVVDLMQVHNLRDTAVHMNSIRELQDEGRVRYNGLTHYIDAAHEELEREMLRHKPDFIQINYSLGERHVEERILPLASNMGIAVLINRPFRRGQLFGAVSGKTLPDWAQSFAASWGQFFLKFIISHPAVTCVIPATSKPHHMIDNLGAGTGDLPDTAMRKRMAEFFASI